MCPDALGPRSPSGKIHAGIMSPDMRAERIIAWRRPKNWLMYPIIVPPMQAPVFMMIDAREYPRLNSAVCFVQTIPVAGRIRGDARASTRYTERGTLLLWDRCVGIAAAHEYFY